ncbi:MAG: peptidoglycan-binding domain-containing protein [Pseudomonadota bacterium]|nr:peptidoglycan-binding domain-containing protein [Pseudomonadota bacterium]
MVAAAAQAGVHRDAHGNVGYDTAAECDAAVRSGQARFYRPFTEHEPLRRDGEATVEQMTLADLAKLTNAASGEYKVADYTGGACDLGASRRFDRDGVSPALQGKWVPFAPTMPVNVYRDGNGVPVRVTMQRCDNNFASSWPRPVGPVQAVAAIQCYADVLIPARFETKTEQVVKVPATKRYEVVPPTFKTVTEQVMVRPEMKRQIPVPATYKTVSEEVVVKPETFREEPVEPTYKMVSEQILVKPESERIEVVPATYKTVSEQVLVTPERKTLKVVPATYTDKQEQVIDRPATTRVETVPATYRTETEQVLVRAESVRYEPIALPLRTVTEQVLRSEGSQRLVAVEPTYKTVTERVLVKEESKRLVQVPAVFETVTERVKVADATRVWKRGRAWIGKAIDVKPLRGFVVGRDGTFQGDRVEVPAAVGGASVGVVDTDIVRASNTNLDDDVMCLVEEPARYENITRQVLKTPATVREEIIPAEYTTVSRQELVTPAGTRTVDVPATYQNVTHRVIDVEKLKANGYRFDDKGDIVATPAGDRVLRAADVPGTANHEGQSQDQTGATAGAHSGQEGYVREIKVPAEYRTVTRTVVDQPASVRTVEVPATYKTVTTRVVATPATTEELVTPAEYRTVTRTVVDQPATSRAIPVPAEYRTVERQVVDQPATTRKIPVPAITEMVSRRVIDTPATLREEVIPAVYETVSRQVVDQPATTREIDVPAVYETLTHKVQVSQGSTERREVLCETNATPSKIMEIQRALRAAGYNPGPINGVLRAQTMSAVNAYQKANNLPVDGFLNIDTVKSLGVQPF